MSYDAFTSGVEPGGLTDTNQIKILICYMLSSVASGLASKDITEMLAQDGLVNYFESAQAVAELEQLGHIKLCGGLCVISDSGRSIAGELETALPISVREKAVAGALRAERIYQNAKDNRAVISDSPDGYEVTCEVYDRMHLLMSTVITVPDRLQAQVIKDRFMKNPTFIYSSTLALYTASKDDVADIVSSAAEDII